MNENKIAVDRIVDDIVDNFKEITGYDVADVFNKNVDEPVFNQDVISKSVDNIKKYVLDNYDVDIIANEDILYALDAKLAEMHNRAVDAAESDSEDPDFIVNESTWAETEVTFGPIAQKKLEVILDADLFDDFEAEVDDNKLTSGIITGIFTDMYRVAKKDYSDYSEDEIKAARKELFRIINKFYKMAIDETETNTDTEESLIESESDRVREVIHTSADLAQYRYIMGLKVKKIADSIKSMKVKYPEYHELFDNLVDELIDTLKDTDNTSESEPKSNVEESYDPPKDMGKMAIEISDYLGEFMNKSDYLDDKYFDEYDREAMGQTFDALVDYARTKNAEGLSESATEVTESNADTDQNADKQYIIFDMLDDENEDNDRLYSKSEAISFLKELLKIEEESVPKSRLDFLTRRREDEGLNFDLDNLSDAELNVWFKEFNYNFFESNKVEDAD